MPIDSGGCTLIAGLLVWVAVLASCSCFTHAVLVLMYACGGTKPIIVELSLLDVDVDVVSQRSVGVARRQRVSVFVS